MDYLSNIKKIAKFETMKMLLFANIDSYLDTLFKKYQELIIKIIINDKYAVNVFIANRIAKIIIKINNNRPDIKDNKLLNDSLFDLKNKLINICVESFTTTFDKTEDPNYKNKSHEEKINYNEKSYEENIKKFKKDLIPKIKEFINDNEKNIKPLLKKYEVDYYSKYLKYKQKYLELKAIKESRQSINH